MEEHFYDNGFGGLEGGGAEGEEHAGLGDVFGVFGEHVKALGELEEVGEVGGGGYGGAEKDGDVRVEEDGVVLWRRI